MPAAQLGLFSGQLMPTKFFTQVLIWYLNCCDLAYFPWKVKLKVNCVCVPKGIINTFLTHLS